MGKKALKASGNEAGGIKLTPKRRLKKKIRAGELEILLRPGGGERYYLIPDDMTAGVELARIEKLIQQRHFGQALKCLENLKVPSSSFKEHYLARIVEKKLRHCAVLLLPMRIRESMLRRGNIIKKPYL